MEDKKFGDTELLVARSDKKYGKICRWMKNYG